MLKNKNIKFIDLFAGIGGFRLGLESVGAECVFSAEIEPHAAEMYEANFGDDPTCDITKLDPSTLPDFDVLCAGFPCQAFSICGKQRGFEDTTRGTLFFDICRILKEKKPKAFILENVKNLEKHDKGNTLFIMLQELNSLGYSVNYKVLNARDFGVPQNRERIILVGSKDGYIFNFDKIKLNRVNNMKPFLEKEGEFEFLEEGTYTLLKKEQIREQKSGLIFCGYRNKKIRTTGVRPGTEHLSRVHKQPNRIYSAEGIHPTIASQETSGRYWILTDGKVRKLTLDECYTFMGFPKDFIKVGRKTKLYERIGNSICVPMITKVAEEVLKQFFIEEEKMESSVESFLEDIYKAASVMTDDDICLGEDQRLWADTISEKEETFKGVYTVTVTSLVYKCLHPDQDIRLHQANMDNGYSGRSFDTKYITPFLKQKKFFGAMKESGWLTRSLEQNLPYDLDYPGKINSKKVKTSFLNILNDVEVNNANPKEYLLKIFFNSISLKEKKAVKLINPIVSESSIDINTIMELLNRHFYYKYKSRGASILPVVALYSVYECIVEELRRFKGKKLQKLASHTSSDRSSGNTGDIVVLNSDNTLYEVVEVKFDIAPDYIMVDDGYKKICETPIQRYYILSTMSAKDDEIDEIYELIEKIRKEHGCQVIINGVIPTIKYYLRLLEDTDKFIEKYIKNLEEDEEINYEHKIAWNNMLSEYKMEKENI